jgi:protein TonB
MPAADHPAPGLPPPGWWVLSLTLHACVLGAVTLAPDAPRTMPPAEPLPVRVVWIEPAPPRGAPAAAADADRTTAHPPAVAPRPKQRPAAPPPAIAPRPVAAPPPHRPRPPEPASAAPAPAAVAATAGVPAPGDPAGFAAADGDTPGGTRTGAVGGRVGGRGDQPLPLSQAATPPTLAHRVPPEYPRRARARGIEGLVLLAVVVGRDGMVEGSPSVRASVPMLDEAAVAAVRRWRFRPARDAGGAPVRVIMEVPVRFVLR